MSRDEAVQYLIDHGCDGSEWEQAGMWETVRKVYAAELEAFQSRVGCERWLDALIEEALEY